MEAVEYLGVPFGETEKKALEDALKDPDGKRAAKTIQEVLDARCLIGVRVTSGLRLTTKASPLAGDAKLLEGGWRQFLIKVHNEARAKVALSVSSPDAAKLPGSPSEDIERRWLDLKMFQYIFCLVWGREILVMGTIYIFSLGAHIVESLM